MPSLTQARAFGVLILLGAISLGCQPTPLASELTAPPAAQSPQRAPTIPGSGHPGGTVSAQETGAGFSVVRVVEYDVRETLTLSNRGPGQPAKQNVWLALIRDIAPYQQVCSLQITPEDYRVITDEYGNQYAEFDLADMPAGSTRSIQVQYQVAVSELEYDLSTCAAGEIEVVEAELPHAFTQAELHIESSNAQIIELAEQLSEGRQTACEQARAFYDYIGDNLFYSYNSKSWGAQAALGEMGADCTEYASLMIALCRASGIPARYVEGLTVSASETETGARTEHAWLEAFLPGVGWTPIDPTMGRFPINRERYFARILPDHIIVTVGRNPSTLRGASYWTHLYWPGNSSEIRVEGFDWTVAPSGP